MNPPLLRALDFTAASGKGEALRLRPARLLFYSRPPNRRFSAPRGRPPWRGEGRCAQTTRTPPLPPAHPINYSSRIPDPRPCQTARFGAQSSKGLGSGRFRPSASPARRRWHRYAAPVRLGGRPVRPGLVRYGAAGSVPPSGPAGPANPFAIGCARYCHVAGLGNSPARARAPEPAPVRHPPAAPWSLAAILGPASSPGLRPVPASVCRRAVGAPSRTAA